MKTLVVILGPTASGKTALSIKIATFLGTEIVNADSRQFYREMDIGTAKPGPDELNAVKHHFINTLSPEDDYTVGKFENEALSTIDAIFQKHDQALLVGGSGLYIRAVCEGLDELPESDPEIRSRLSKKFQEQGIAALQQELESLDPEYFLEVDRMNPHRLIRAIEVCLLSGEKYSVLRKSAPKNRSFQLLKIGLLPEREVMYERINMRVEQMISDGLVEEVRKLQAYKNCNALHTVGYQELFPYLENQTTLEQAIDEIKKNTRRYAKRQVTWFKKDTSIHWFQPDMEDEIFELLKPLKLKM
jgi:tRNA dimethylallyltransferase